MAVGIAEADDPGVRSVVVDRGQLRLAAHKFGGAQDGVAVAAEVEVLARRRPAAQQGGPLRGERGVAAALTNLARWASEVDAQTLPREGQKLVLTVEPSLELSPSGAPGSASRAACLAAARRGDRSSRLDALASL